MVKKKTQYLKFRGIVEWAHVYKPDEYGGKKFWKINFLPDLETYLEMREAGVQTKLKIGKEQVKKWGEDCYFTFRRDCEKIFDGVRKKFTPPAVLDKNGDYLVKYTEDDGEIIRHGEPVLIGNGSEVEILLEIYDAGPYGTGTRLVEVKILDLIEYEKPEEKEVEVVEEEVKPRSKPLPETKTKEIKKSKVDW